MKVDEQDRQSLRERLDMVLGEHPAEVLMGMLDGTAGQDLATRDDVLAIGTCLDRIDTRLDRVDTRLEGIDTRLDGIDLRLDRVDTRFEMVDARFEKLDARFESRIADQTRTMVFTGFGIAISTWGLLFAALGFG